ncbi:hypothetical protein EW146_g8285 [Bondarzewia mesenterica]|uniref:Uncharacterized protein n=1 Tax=Bondarzewia mesenterica TaxID=1095465 RepID=A0A4S4LFM8_9AGAM|nr:hypothetical protein EW146_g8285 [Bondarzewia mesenterica]
MPPTIELSTRPRMPFLIHKIRLAGRGRTANLRKRLDKKFADVVMSLQRSSVKYRLRRMGGRYLGKGRNSRLSASESWALVDLSVIEPSPSTLPDALGIIHKPRPNVLLPAIPASDESNSVSNDPSSATPTITTHNSIIEIPLSPVPTINMHDAMAESSPARTITMRNVLAESSPALAITMRDAAAFSSPVPTITMHDPVPGPSTSVPSIDMRDVASTSVPSIVMEDGELYLCLPPSESFEFLADSQLLEQYDIDYRDLPSPPPSVEASLWSLDSDEVDYRGLPYGAPSDWSLNSYDMSYRNPDSPTLPTSALDLSLLADEDRDEDEVQEHPLTHSTSIRLEHAMRVSGTVSGSRPRRRAVADSTRSTPVGTKVKKGKVPTKPKKTKKTPIPKELSAVEAIMIAKSAIMEVKAAEAPPAPEPQPQDVNYDDIWNDMETAMILASGGSGKPTPTLPPPPTPPKEKGILPIDVETERRVMKALEEAVVGNRASDTPCDELLTLLKDVRRSLALKNALF